MASAKTRLQIQWFSLCNEKSMLSISLSGCPLYFPIFLAALLCEGWHGHGGWVLIPQGSPIWQLSPMLASSGEINRVIKRWATSGARFASYSHRHLKKNNSVIFSRLKNILLINLDICAFLRICCEDPYYARSCTMKA